MSSEARNVVLQVFYDNDRSNQRSLVANWPMREKIVVYLGHFDKMMTAAAMVDAGMGQWSNDVRGMLWKKMISTGLNTPPIP